MSTWTDEKHEEARTIGFGFTFYDPGICELVADAVTEIERLRAFLEVNDEMVGRAHAAVVDHLSANAGCVYAEDEGPDMLRAALEAALNPKGAPDA